MKKQHVRDLMWEHIAHPLNRQVCKLTWNIPHITKAWQTISPATKLKGSVLIIQGFFGSFYGYRKLGDYLHIAGYKVYYLDTPVKKTLEPVARIAERYIDYIEKENLPQPLNIIGHSKGGLVAKYIAFHSAHTNEGVNKIITIATPHRGTKWGHIHFLNLKELKPKSQLIRALSSPEVEQKTVSIHNAHDQFVSRSGAHVDCGENHLIDVWGHKQILFDERTMRLILDILEP